MRTRISLPNIFARQRRVTRTTVALATALLLALSTAVVGVAPAATAAGSSCGTTINQIACENSKPGAEPDEWDINGAGDGSIQGFSTDISVNVGKKIDFKIDTDARAYSVNIYRTGYYQGLGARKIATVTPSVTLPQTQPQCISDQTTELYDCGTWKVSASWTVPADAISGVYIAVLQRADTGGRSHITFIVRDDSSHAQVLFQTSDPTWQAYNTYGGSDFYQGAANGRAYKISYNRPVATRGDNSGRDFYFANEYPMVRFLEKNGYDVSYFSGVDTDRYGSLLTNHSVFLSVGHDEYWSTGQRANVEKARDAGVNLQFLSGNEAYWHTRYEPSIDTSATAYRTLVSYKETWAVPAGKIDPSPTWTGTWRDPRFASVANGASKPENNLTGTMYMANFSDLPITVSATEGKTRLWRNTSLTSLAAGTSQALAPHTIGYESDEDVDNLFRQSGLIHLSTTTGAVPQYLQDFGSTNVAAGNTTHHLTLYRAASGALVFGAGTVQWTWGLDQEHDGNGAAADPRMQQAQVNILADMGAQPTTLTTGLVATAASNDRTAPTVTITAPTVGSTIANGSTVTLKGTASDVGGVVAGIEVSTDGSTWHMATGTTSWSYTYVQQGAGAQKLQVRAVDDSANYAATPTSVTVTVGGPYSVFGESTPAVVDSGDATPIEVGLKFTPTANGFVSGVRFYKGAANTGTHTGSLWSPAGVRLATATFSNETASGWQTVPFSSSVAVTAGTTYTVSYNAPNGHYSATNDFFSYARPDLGPLSVASGFGSLPPGVYNTNGEFPTDTYENSNYWVDAVFTSSDTSALTAGSQWPAASSTDVPVDTTISATLSRAVTSASVAFAVKDQNGAAVPGATTYDSTSRVATFTPKSALAGFVVHSVTLSATDTNGVALSSGATWSFTTAKPANENGACPCSLFSTSTVPTMLQDNDPNAVSLGIKFTTTSAGQITGLKFYKGPNNTGTHVGTLWSSTGVALASANFINETASGWQTVSFGTPVSVTAGGSYVASYRTTVGKYSATVGAYTTGGFTSGPLTVAAQAGVYSYPDVFPSSTSSADYGVDVVFQNAAPSLSVSSQTPAPGSVGVDRGTSVSVTLSSAITAGYALSVASGSTTIAGTTSLSSDGKTVTFVPSATLPNAATVSVILSGAKTAGGATLATTGWSFTTADTTATSTTTTLFGTETPTVVAATDDASSVELGVAFTPSVAGSVTAIRFFKGAGNTGAHVGHLWSPTGALLATANFSSETATGWQSAALSTPVALVAGQKYVVSYLAPNGHYSYTSNYFASAKVSGPLTAPSGSNGLFLYGAGGAAPSFSYESTNYFVDVAFTVQNGSASPSPTPTVTPTPTPTPTPTVTPTPTPTVTPTPTPTPTSASLFAVDAVPTNSSWADPGAVQVGVRFTTSVAGTIAGIRFYKGSGNTGTHQVYLWNAAGNQLATATAITETASGWQTVTFSSPIAIVPGTEYRASYYAPKGYYAVNINGLAAASTSGPLSTVATGGAYVYGTTAPTNYVAHNYWVDVNFTASS